MLGGCHYNLAFLCCECASLMADALNLVVKGSLLVEVTNFIAISFILKIVSLLFCEGLPLLSHFLHDLERSHFNVCIHNQWTCLDYHQRLDKFIYIKMSTLPPSQRSYKLRGIS